MAFPHDCTPMNATSTPGLHGRDLLLVFAIILAWAGNFLTSALALREIPPFLFTALGFALLALPLLFLLGLFTSLWLSAAVLALYALSFWKTWRGLAGQPMAAKQAALLTLAKIPNLLGMLTYYRRRRTGDDMRIIEYK